MLATVLGGLFQCRGKLGRCMSQRRCVKASSVADAALMVALLLPLD